MLRDLKPQDKLDRRLLPSFAGLLPEAMARHQRAIGTPESYAVAEAQLKRALKLFERGRNDGLRVRAHLMLSDVYDHLGDRGRMEEHHDLGLQLRRKVTGEAP